MMTKSTIFHLDLTCVRCTHFLSVCVLMSVIVWLNFDKNNMTHPYLSKLTFLRNLCEVIFNLLTKHLCKISSQPTDRLRG